MSNKMVRGAVAAAVTALAISGSAYGAGKSPNGPPGPAGNPNQPTSAPQANAPQGQGGNEQQKAQNKGQQKKAQRTAGTQQSHGKSTQPHGNSGAPTQSHGKSGSAPGHSNGSHASPTPGTPKSNENNGAPKGKITICHATKSETNPYVEITISVNGLHGHGPADEPHH